jgi:catechol 2,3-dioxygenase-like lactoylglutathione lyase family enzyme
VLRAPVVSRGLALDSAPNSPGSRIQGRHTTPRRSTTPHYGYIVDQPAETSRTGSLHHVELWVPDLARAAAQWGWLLTRLGYEQFQDWEDGRSWRLRATYLVVEQSPTLSATEHDRLRPGLNHLAFHAGGRDDVDALAKEAPGHGWQLLFADRHPYAGGPDHYAAYLANADGFEVELVAR